MNLTIFCDIDGTLVPHAEKVQSMSDVDWYKREENLPMIQSSRDKLLEWHTQGLNVILTTGRPNTMRNSTEALLEELGLIHNQLVMDCGCGPRILINDKDPNQPDINKALAMNLIRDEGVGGFSIQMGVPDEECEEQSEE